ncbi:MAG: PilZ domain-containing protein [Magnetococcales bacterium]|nr:PilZ domain-containing protein [Magnetococcales bacterium]
MNDTKDPLELKRKVTKAVDRRLELESDRRASEQFDRRFLETELPEDVDMRSRSDRRDESGRRDAEDASRRKWEREWINVPMLFVTTSGRAIDGTTHNISLNGVDLDLGREISGISPEMEGSLLVDVEGRTHRFPCSVVRATGGHLILTIDSSMTARFGALISLQQLSTMRDGISLTEQWDAARSGKSVRR